MSQTDTQTDTLVTTKLTPPSRWQVIIINDEITPMEFVVSILIAIFKQDQDTALQTMLHVHERGWGVAGTYSFEIAEQKAIESSGLAKTTGYPLKLKLEEE